MKQRKDPQQIYWDSDCFLGHFNSEEGKTERCKETLKRAENREIIIMTSVFTLAEVLYLKNRKPIPKSEAHIIKQFFKNDYIRTANLNRYISEFAQDLFWDHGIKPKDAIHVSTALNLQSVEILETFDKNLISKSNTFYRPLFIRTPLLNAQINSVC